MTNSINITKLKDQTIIVKSKAKNPDNKNIFDS